MMAIVPFLALLIGAMAATLMGLPHLTGQEGQYLAVACLAGFDTILGGIRGGLEGRFENSIFVSGFMANIFIALLLVFLGDRIYQPLYLVVAFVFGNRIFSNLSLIRRSVMTKVQDEVARRKRQAALSTSSEPGA